MRVVKWSGWVLFAALASGCGGNGGSETDRRGSAPEIRGVLDPSFGDAGKMQLHLRFTDQASSLAIQADGKILLAGSSGGTFVMVRCLPDGTLDDSFGTDGATTDLPGEEASYAHDVAVQEDGRIVVAGWMLHPDTNTPPDIFLGRFLSDGTPDPAFGTSGWTLFDLDSDIQYAYELAIQSDGRIVVGGTTRDGTFDFLVARFLEDGSLDPEFSLDGWLVLPIGSGSDQAYDLVLDDQERILLAGISHNGTDTDMALVRILPDGTPDPDFGTGGISILDSGSDDTATAIAVSDSRIFVAGWTVPALEAEAIVTRWNLDGNPDASFGTGGRITYPSGSSGGIFRDLISAPNGKLIATGSALEGTDNRFVTMRIDFDGGLDPGFGDSGIVFTNFGAGDDYAVEAAFQADGKLLVAGSAHNGTDFDLALVRYE